MASWLRDTEARAQQGQLWAQEQETRVIHWAVCGQRALGTQEASVLKVVESTPWMPMGRGGCPANKSEK